MRIAPIVAAALLAVSTVASGEYQYVGSGPQSAKVLVEFSDGTAYAFGVSFRDPSTTGIGLMDIIEAGTTLTTLRVDDPYFGTYIDGISYKGHSNSGYGGGELYWHYWTKEPAADWVWSMVGASSRVVADGCADGWVYGRDGAPRLPGDANGDLAVGTGDLSIMASNWMTGGGKTWADGDFNGDGAVGTGDLALLATNWMFGQMPAPAPIPEPATLLFLAAGLAVLRRRGC